MLCVTNCEKATAKKFQRKLKPHLAALKSQKCACSVHQCRETGHTTLGDRVSLPESDVTHVFDREMILALSHAIEDLAAEAKEGELIATFQNFEQFGEHKARYCRMAKDLDAVRVWGAGEPPSGCAKIDFVVAHNPQVLRYWLVIFDSPNSRAVLLGKQIKQRGNAAGSGKFVGFYSFNPFLVQSIRRRFNLLSCGLNKIVQLWEKSCPLPDLKPGDITGFESGAR
jgi:hypothetical protein